MGVMPRVLRVFAIVASAVIALSFVLFAVEEVREASSHQVEAVAPDPAAESARAARHTKAREAVDDANDLLLTPFAGLIGDDGNDWARRGIPALIGLLLYGLVLLYLARMLQTRSHTLVRHHPAPAPPPPSGSQPPPV